MSVLSEEKRRRMFWNAAGATLLVAFALIAVAWIVAYQEARTYNRLTGNKITTWDALWVRLRVQDTPQDSNRIEALEQRVKALEEKP